MIFVGGEVKSSHIHARFGGDKYQLHRPILMHTFSGCELVANDYRGTDINTMA